MRNFQAFMLMCWLALAFPIVALAQPLQAQAERAANAAALKARQLAAIHAIMQAANAQGAEGTPENASVLRSSLAHLAEIESAEQGFDDPAPLAQRLAGVVALPDDAQASFQKNLFHHYKQVLEQVAEAALPTRERIVLGSAQRDPLFPDVVAIRDDKDNVCTGIYFRPNKVLTAAHCVCDLTLNQPTQLHSITFGDDFKNGTFLGSNRIIRKILHSSVSIYPDLPGTASSFCDVLASANNDIHAAGVDLALLTLAPGVAIPDFPETQLAGAHDVQATTAGQNESIRPFFAVGFGKSDSWKRPRMQLNLTGSKRGTTILNGHTCPSSGTFGGSGNNCQPDTEVAAFDASGRDSCGGDSGGPLFVRNADTTRWLLAGVTSRGLGLGNGCGQGGIYSLVVRSNVRAWMRSNGVTYGG